MLRRLLTLAASCFVLLLIAVAVVAARQRPPAIDGSDGQAETLAWWSRAAIQGLFDYRVWSGSKGVRFSAMLFPPRKTDTLTLERTSAFSSLTPTHLILTRDIRLGGFTLDPGTVLDLAGYSVMLRIGARFQIGETVYEGYQHTSSSLGVAEVIDSSDPDTGTIILEQPGTVVRVL